MSRRHPLFIPAILLGGMVFGVGLASSRMARPEVVLDFLQFEDFGLLFVLGGAVATTSIVFAIATHFGDSAPLTGVSYKRRLTEFDRNIVLGGSIFGVGWGLSGICPGAAYASFGIGNVTILWAIGGMFLGAYLQGLWRQQCDDQPATAAAD
jgi:hypothetical protein